MANEYIFTKQIGTGFVEDTDKVRRVDPELYQNIIEAESQGKFYGDGTVYYTHKVSDQYGDQIWRNPSKYAKKTTANRNVSVDQTDMKDAIKEMRNDITDMKQYLEAILKKMGFEPASKLRDNTNDDHGGETKETPLAFGGIDNENPSGYVPQGDRVDDEVRE